MSKAPIHRLLKWHARRQSPGSGRVARYASRYLAHYGNQNRDMAENGEVALLQRFAPFLPKVVFDVGANEGEWSRAARKLLPQAEIHAFEINEPLAQKTAERLGSGVFVHPFGLAEIEGTVDLTVYDSDSSLSSIVGGVDIYETPSTTEPGKVKRGDTFCAERGIEHIDMLKIDAEGAEPRVLKGFSDLIGRGRVDVIQFEYGITNVYSRFLLRDFYDTLAGYRIGKLFPRGVKFADYSPYDEDFRGPNFVAVLKSRGDIADAIALAA
jgi:FkbM family methyltransferase